MTTATDERAAPAVARGGGPDVVPPAAGGPDR